MLDQLGADMVRLIIALARDAAPAGERLPDEFEPARDTDQLGMLEAAIGRLSSEARQELRAVLMTGRGDYAAGQWNEALAEALSISDESEVRALAEDPQLVPFLSKGLYQLGLA